MSELLSKENHAKAPIILTNMIEILPLRVMGRREKESKGQRGWRTPGDQGPLNEVKNSHRNSENEAAGAAPDGSAAGLLSIYQSY